MNISMKKTYFPMVVTKWYQVFYTREGYHSYIMIIMFDDDQQLKKAEAEDNIWTAVVECSSENNIKIDWLEMDIEPPEWFLRNKTKFSETVKKNLRPACKEFKRFKKRVHEAQKHAEKSRYESIFIKESLILQARFRKLAGYVWDKEAEEGELELYPNKKMAI